MDVELLQQVVHVRVLHVDWRCHIFLHAGSCGRGSILYETFRQLQVMGRQEVIEGLRESLQGVPGEDRVVQAHREFEVLIFER